MRGRKARLQKSISSGSPLSGEPEFLVVGKLRRPHGVHGEILMDVLTDFPERLKPDVTVYVGEQLQPLCIRNTRDHRQALLVRFDDYTNRESVGELRNKFVYVQTKDRPPLPEGEYYYHELIGLRVDTDMGETLGVLTDILETGANDVYIVSPDKGQDILLPAIPSVVLEINLEQGRILVHILPGLISDR
jgi:16S rRNA processing protein RimM